MPCRQAVSSSALDRLVTLSRFPSLHPAVRLLLWCALVMVGQGLTGSGLAVSTLGVLLLGGFFAGGHLRRLIRRARFLLLTLALVFVCATPGEALLPLLGAASPTAEGLLLAAQHGGRLVLVLGLLALLLQFTPSAQFVAGVFGLLKPFAAWGLPREKMALRLMLVLQYAEERKGEGRLESWRQWLHWLEGEDSVASAPVSLAVAPLKTADFAALGTLLLAAFAACFY